MSTPSNDGNVGPAKGSTPLSPRSLGLPEGHCGNSGPARPDGNDSNDGSDGANGSHSSGGMHLTSLRSALLSTSTRALGSGGVTTPIAAERSAILSNPSDNHSQVTRKASFIDIDDSKSASQKMARGHSDNLAHPRGTTGSGGTSPSTVLVSPLKAGANGNSPTPPRSSTNTNTNPNTNTNANSNANSNFHAMSPSPGFSGGSGYTAGSVYAVRLDGDSGGIEMDLARETLTNALYLRDRYHSHSMYGGGVGAQRQPCHGSNGGPSATRPTTSAPQQPSLSQQQPQQQPPQQQQQQPQQQPFNAAAINLRMDDGVFVFGDYKAPTAAPAVSWEAFCEDIMTLQHAVQQPACLSACRYRLEVLEEKFSAYKLSNSDMEVRDVGGKNGANRRLRLGNSGNAAAAAAAGGTASSISGTGAAGGAAAGGGNAKVGSGIFADCCRVDNGVLFEFMASPQALVDHIRETVEVRGEEDVVAFLRTGNGGGGAGGAGGAGAGRGSAGPNNFADRGENAYQQQLHQLVDNNNNNGGGDNNGGSGRNAAAPANANGGEPVTLLRMCKLLGFPEPHHITVDALGIQPSGDHPVSSYDPLDPSQNQAGPNSAALLRLFLSRDTLNDGDYFAQLVRPCLARNEMRTRSPQATETIIDITGVIPDEWARTALWLKSKDLLGDAGSGSAYRNNRYIVSFSRQRMLTAGNGGGLGGAPGANPVSLFSGGGDGTDMGGGGAGASAAGVGAGSGAGGHSRLPAVYTGAPEPVTLEHQQQHIDNLFLPLFLATVAPEDPHNGAVADFLSHVGAIIVIPLETASLHTEANANGNDADAAAANDGSEDGDGSNKGKHIGGSSQRINDHRHTRPMDIPWSEVVSDVYFIYYVWANLCSLNALRRMRGLNTLQLRVVAASDGVAGSGAAVSSGAAGGKPYGGDLKSGGSGGFQVPDSLLVSYLLADNVYNALALSDLPVLQYLFSLKRIGVCMSPLSSNALGTAAYMDHPFCSFFRRGLRVSLGTFAPLLFHHSTVDPLLEEFSAAGKLYRLSGVDVCEISLNSVVMSTFPDTDSHYHSNGNHKYGLFDEGPPFGVGGGGAGGVATKAAWLGEAFVREGWRGNVYALSKVPTARLAMREDLWMAEMEVVHGNAHHKQSAYGKHGGSASTPPSAVIWGGSEGGGRWSGEEQRLAGSDGASTGALAPYLVTDPSISFPRVTFVGPYHNETQHAVVAQHLHRALELRRMYTRSSYRSAGGGSGGVGANAMLASAAAAEGKANPDTLSVLANLDSDTQTGSITEYLAFLMELYLSVVGGGGGGGRASLPSGQSVAAKGGVGATGGVPLTHQQLQSRGLEAAFSRKQPHSGGATGKKLGVGEEDMDFDESEWMYKTVEGVVVPHEVHQIPRLPQDMFHYDDFCVHVEEIRAMASDGHIRSFATRRLRLLENRFMLHTAVNHSLEAGSTADKASQNRDFYQSTKVDGAVRMEAGMPARLLLDFIIDKANNSGDDIVSHEKAREPQTLRQLLKELDISPETLTVDDLDVQVDPTLDWGGASFDEPGSHNSNNNNNVVRSDASERSDETNSSDRRHSNALKGQERRKHSRRRGRDILLSLLLRTNNQMNGRYFAELTKRTFENLGRDRFTFTESRLRVYGASSEEWSQLSTWFDTHGMSSARNQWMVEVPRSYGLWRRQGKVRHFAEFLENIFTPLWAVSLHPSRDPRLFHFLNNISAFDCVAAGVELASERGSATTTATSSASHHGRGSGGKEPISQQPLSSLPPPHEWGFEEDPPFNYYLYHLWANITSLNAFRRRRRFSQFAFRPSCGEAGPVDHLIGGFLLANSITYGVGLKSATVLQYLYYLARIGIVMCPLSNNSSAASSRASTLQQNPFPLLFKRGLCVTLGTDCPLKYHHTQEPLVEEYSIASKMWKLSPTDMCEIARNSVLMSGFGSLFKMRHLGELFFLSSSWGNNTSKTHLSDVRVAYRFEAYHCEMGYLEYVSGQVLPKAMLTLKEEETVLSILNNVRDHAKAQHQHRRTTPIPTSGEDGGMAYTNLIKEGAAAGDASANGTVGGFGDTIIDATPDAAELQRLLNRRIQMRRQVEELTDAVAQLQKHNQQLTAKLYEERERDQQAALLRRQHLEGRVSTSTVKSAYCEQLRQVLGEDGAQQPNYYADGCRALPPLPADAIGAAAKPPLSDVLELRSGSVSVLSGNDASAVVPDSDSSRALSRSGRQATTLQLSSSISATPTVAPVAMGGARLSSMAVLPSSSSSPPNPGALLGHTEFLWSRATHPNPSYDNEPLEDSSGGGARRMETAAATPTPRLPLIHSNNSNAVD